MNDKEIQRAQLCGSLLLFTQVFYKIRTGRDFEISQPISRESHHRLISRALTKTQRGELKRLLIHCPPRYGKSELAIHYIAWCIAQFPDSNFLYVSYSKTLAMKQTQTIREIISHPEYKRIFGVTLKDDTTAKDDFMTNYGGSVVAAGAGGTITGRGAGIQNIDRFGGSIVCFPYDEYVQTEVGPMKIGDIVSQKIKINVYSKDLITNEIQLKRIEAWHKNPGRKIVEITFDDGAQLRCTPEHRIWTQRGWVEAQDLLSYDKLPAPSPYCSLRKSKHLAGISLFNAKIFENFKLFFGKRIKLCFSDSWRSNLSSFFGISPSFSSIYNRLNNLFGSIIFNSKLFGCHFAHDHINDILFAKSAIRMSFTKPKCSMFNRVLNIIRTSSIAKIFNSIIKSITINMSHINPFVLRADKSPCYQTMDSNMFGDSINGHCGHKIPDIFSFLFDFWRLYSKRSMITIKNLALFTSHIPKIRYAVKPLIARDRSPLFIKNISHADTTFCISVKDNHNFFCGSREDFLVLVSNCDDLHKPIEISSDTMRQSVIDWYLNTLQSRVNSPSTPVIYIGQRLHEDDLATHLAAGFDGHDWTTLSIPALDISGNALNPKMHDVAQLRRMQETMPYDFASQYQQNPQPAGGGIFKPGWWPLLTADPPMLATFVVADTAETEKTYNDATAFLFVGLYKIIQDEIDLGIYGLHVIDATEIWVEPKDLESEYLAFFASCMRHPVKPLMGAIEPKSTGSTLMSIMKSRQGFYVHEIKRSKTLGSKTTRYLNCQPYVAARRVSLPMGAQHTDLVIEHMRKITANQTHARDDLCDTICDAIQIGLIDKIVNIPDNVDQQATLKRYEQMSRNRLNATVKGWQQK